MNRYIDADAFVADSKWCGLKTAEQVLFALDHQPSIDIVRCKECQWRNTKRCIIHFFKEDLKDDDYCSYGEREGE